MLPLMFVGGDICNKIHDDNEGIPIPYTS